MSIIDKHKISKTVYSLYFPEVENILKNIWENSCHLHEKYQNTFSKKQDQYHVSFLNKYKDWSSDVLKVNWDNFKYSYPTNGASEAIREQIAYLSNKGYEKLYVLEGEYEGYEALAKPFNFEVIKVKRSEVFTFNYSKKKSLFFISQPSSIDGNVWDEFNSFISKMNKEHSNIRFYLDVVYIGCVEKEYSVDIKDFSNIDGIFFSLSKVFGVYYHRIGGCYLKEENPLLYGNIWFKNIFSMYFGEQLMNIFNVHSLPKKYSNLKNNTIRELEKELGVKVESSDVLMLANVEKENANEYLNSELSRSAYNSNLRVCLTPIIETKIRS